MDKMVVYSLGSKVYLEDGNLEVRVLSIQLTDNHIRYEVCWWDGKTRKTDWVYDSEISYHSNSSCQEIGFHNAIDN